MTDNNALAQELEATYDRCKLFPERTADGQVALLELRNLTPRLLEALRTPAPAPVGAKEIAAHIETLEFLSGQYLPGGPRDIKGALRAAISALQHPAPASDENLSDWIAEARVHASDMPPVIQRDYLNAALDKLERLASQPTAQPSDLVERVARIISPSSWAVMDAEKARMLRKYKGQDIGWPADQFQHKESMAKAREILAAMQGLEE